MDKVFQKAQELREKLMKLLRRCYIDTVKDEKLSRLTAMDFPPVSSTEHNSAYFKAREKSWLISLLSLATYALAKVADASTFITRLIPFSGLNRCKEIAVEFARSLGLKNPYVTCEILE